MPTPYFWDYKQFESIDQPAIKRIHNIAASDTVFDKSKALPEGLNVLEKFDKKIMKLAGVWRGAEGKIIAKYAKKLRKNFKMVPD